VALAEARTDADEHFRRGLELARTQKAKAWELRLVLSQSRLLAARGEIALARADLAYAYQSFTEGRDTGDLRAAQRELENLERASEAR
jgi:hypothetical protein